MMMFIYYLCCLIAEHEGLVVVLTGLCLQRRSGRYIGCVRLERRLDTLRFLPFPGRSRIFRDRIPRECLPLSLLHTMNFKCTSPEIEICRVWIFISKRIVATRFTQAMISLYLSEIYEISQRRKIDDGRCLDLLRAIVFHLNRFQKIIGKISWKSIIAIQHETLISTCLSISSSRAKVHANSIFLTFWPWTKIPKDFFC